MDINKKRCIKMVIYILLLFILAGVTSILTMSVM